MSNKTKKIFFNIILLTISILVSFSVAEIGFRIFLNHRHRHFIEKRQDNVKIYSSNPDCWSLRQDISFQLPKSEDVFRIFAFGGSTTEGSAYPDYKVNFMNFLQLMLEDTYPTIHFEVINFAKSGENSSDVVDKMKLALQYSPDLFIVYTGHNEFLNLIDPYMKLSPLQSFLMKSALYSSIYYKMINVFPELQIAHLIEKRSFIDKPVCDKRGFEKIYANYTRNISKIVKMSQNNGIKLIMLAPTGNYAQWQPNRSVRWRKISSEQDLKWGEYFNKAQNLKNENRLIEASLAFEKCREIDSTFSQVEFEYAELLMKLEKYAQAKRAFKAAVDYDGAPKITCSILINQMCEICVANEIPFINANSVFESYSPHNVNDPILFIDAHHPSWRGDVFIARAVKKTIDDNKYIYNNTPPESMNSHNETELLNRLNITQKDSLEFCVDRAIWYLKSTELRWEGSRRLERAKQLIDEALSMDSEYTKAIFSLAMWASLSNQPHIAKEQLNKIRLKDKNYYNTTLLSPWVYHTLERTGCISKN